MQKTDDPIFKIREVIANKNEILHCAKAFRNEANSLMHRLAKKFNFDINDCAAWPTAVYQTSHINKGTLTDDWTFYLHGAHCRFNNAKTGQVVEVRYTEKPEFGCLDGFLFFVYMQTTDEFKSLATWFENHLNVYDAIDILAEEGSLTKKPGLVSGSYIIAL